MATEAERDRLRALIGTRLVTEGDPEPWTDDELDLFLAIPPRCQLTPGTTAADVYGAAADVWEAKALALQLAAVEAGGDAPLVTSVKQGSAALTYARPVPAGTTSTGPNDPRAMRALANRLRRKSCNGGRFRSVDVAPPDVVRPGRNERLEYDGGDSLYISPRPAILDPVDNPDRVINLPEVDV